MPMVSVFILVLNLYSTLVLCMSTLMCSAAYIYIYIYIYIYL